MPPTSRDAVRDPIAGVVADRNELGRRPPAPGGPDECGCTDDSGLMAPTLEPDRGGSGKAGGGVLR